MRRKKSPAIPPKKRPDLFQIRLRDGQRRELRGGEKRKIAFLMRRRDLRQARQNFEQKQQPMLAILVAVFADDPGQMQIAMGQLHSNFFPGLPAGAGVGRFAIGHLQLAAARAPQAEVGLAGAPQQQRFILLVETIEQRGDFVGQRHVTRIL